MPHDLPNDAKIRRYIDETIQASPDVSLLTRTMIKDGLSKEFKLSAEQREVLDVDKEYKNKIKEWIQEAIANLPSGSGSESDGESGIKGIETMKKKEKKNTAKETPKVKRKVEEKAESEAEAMSEFFSLEDDDDDRRPRKKKKDAGRAKTNKSTKSSKEAGAENKKSGEKDELEKLEMRLKKLKSLVIQCGTRKLWKRIFEEAGCADGDDQAAGAAGDSRKLKKQISIVEATLRDLGMDTPFSQAKAKSIKEEKEMKEDLEAIKQANTTERSATRGGGRKRRGSEQQAKEALASPLTEEEDEVQVAPQVRRFNRSLADFAAELNDD